MSTSKSSVLPTSRFLSKFKSKFKKHNNEPSPNLAVAGPSDDSGSHLEPNRISELHFNPAAEPSCIHEPHFHPAAHSNPHSDLATTESTCIPEPQFNLATTESTPIPVPRYLAAAEPNHVPEPHLEAKSKQVYVRGLLGTYNIQDNPSEDDDMWMATDLVALRQLISASDNASKWFCGKSIRTQRLGDPASDRILFDPPHFETCEIEPRLLAITFLTAVARAACELSIGDTLVIVLVGHGDDDRHSFLIGDEDSFYELEKDVLEIAVAGSKGNILVISTACFSGSWKSPHWTVLAAAGPEQHATSISASGIEADFLLGPFLPSMQTNLTSAPHIQAW
jgi:hypothetical protein